MSIDQIAMNTFEASRLALPMLVGVATTAAGFSWWQFYGKVNEATHPHAKAVANLIMNGRAVTLMALATTSMLLNYASYGPSPWITITALGLGGLPVYLNAERISNWLENNSAIRKATDAYQSLMNHLPFGHPKLCIDLFRVRAVR